MAADAGVAAGAAVDVAVGVDVHLQSSPTVQIYVVRATMAAVELRPMALVLAQTLAAMADSIVLDRVELVFGIAVGMAVAFDAMVAADTAIQRRVY